MRPIKLQMSAFLAYGEEQTIDFSALGRSGLYLINGDTGAGKTTIFDAIMFALYGSPSGDLRETKMFRSKYAANDRDTFVELEFECNGRTYTVRRKPEYERVKKNGKGTTKTAGDATLISETAAPVTGIKEVTAAIEKIIGLTRDQFAQVAMIAQGQFRDLLVADTRTRQAIFRHIFETAGYEAVQARIASDHKKNSDELQSVHKAIAQELGNIRLLKDDEELARIINGEFITDKAIDALDRLIEDQKAEQETNRKAMESASDLQKKLNLAMEAARAYLSDEKQLNEQKIKLLESKKKEEAVKHELDIALKHQEEIEKLNEEIILLNTKTDDYDIYDKLVSESMECSKKVGADTKQKSELADSLAKLSENIRILKEEDQSLGNPEAELARVISSVRETKEKRKDVQSVLERFSNMKVLLTKLAVSEKEKEELTVKESKAFDAHFKARSAYLREQAGILAKELNDGQECPVCGSVHHPKKAVLSSSVCDKKELDRLEEALNSCRVLAEKARNSYAAAKAGYESYRDETMSSAFRFTEGDEPNDVYRKLMALARELDEELEGLIKEEKAASSRADRRSVILKQIPLLEEKSLEEKNTLAELENELSGLKEKAAGLKERTAELKKSLSFDSKKEALAYILAITKKRDELVSSINKKKEEYDRLKLSIGEMEGSIRTLAARVDNAEKFDTDRLSEEFNNNEELLKKGEKDRSEIYAALSSNEGICERVLKYMAEEESLSDKEKWLKALDDTVNGRNSDAGGKIMLETYVQQAYFDRIVNKANRRFEAMTRGQYSLRRAVGADNNRSQSGLDLEVIDHYNSTSRSVKSLSGGEQFEASLSLALGLSDMVQESGAGIKLDCMFIDEGFGSLDDETLSHALSALNDLSQGERLVGIISHVSELERVIDRKITVRKDGRGFSHATVQI